MKRFDLIVHADDVDNIVDDIVWLGAVEVKPYGGGYAMLSSDGAELRDTLADLESAIKNLAPFSREKKRLFAPRPVLLRDFVSSPSGDYSDAVKAAADSVNYLTALNEYNAEKIRLAGIRTPYEPWIDCDLPLDFDGTDNTAAVFGAVPVGVTVDFKDIAAEFITVSQSDRVYGVVICHADDVYALQSVLLQSGFSQSDLPRENVTAGVRIADIDRQISDIDEKIAAIQTALSNIAVQIPNIKIAYDITAAKIVKADLRQQFSATQSAAFIQGYIPASKTGEVQKIADRYACCLDVYDADADAPVLFEKKNLLDHFRKVAGRRFSPAAFHAVYTEMRL